MAVDTHPAAAADSYGPLGAVRVPGGTSVDKASGVVNAFPDIWTGTVLDVGCRSRDLEQALAGRPITYVGLDIFEPADIIADLGEGLPLEDGEVDVVAALDVLEHVDSIHAAFAELCRVASSHVVIALPNGLVLKHRIRQLQGRLPAKYGLPVDPPGDRHRWLFSLDEARRFCHERALLAGWRVEHEAVVVGPRRRRIEPLVRSMPGLLAPSLVVHLVPAG